LLLLGYKKAKFVLENYEEFTGQKTDGELAEIWENAVAVTRWIQNDKDKF
jgi:hypothetical protein